MLGLQELYAMHLNRQLDFEGDSKSSG